MSRKLNNCGKLEVRESPIEGFGVFATAPIKAGEILEEVPFVLFPRHTNISKGIYDLLSNNGFLAPKEKFQENLRINLKFKEPEKYYFKWHPAFPMDGDSMFTVLPLGYGPIYNSSNTDNNADWKIQEKTFLFRAEKDIAVDEEIRTFYGYFLGENGVTYNCDTVFNLAIDTIAGVNRVKLLRFGQLESFQSGSTNPSYIRINQLLSLAKDGLAVKKLLNLNAEGKEVMGYDVPEGTPLSQIYGKIAEFKNHPSPMTVFFFEYENKTDGKITQENIVIKK